MDLQTVIAYMDSTSIADILHTKESYLEYRRNFKSQYVWIQSEIRGLKQSRRMYNGYSTEGMRISNPAYSPYAADTAKRHGKVATRMLEFLQDVRVANNERHLKVLATATVSA